MIEIIKSPSELWMEERAFGFRELSEVERRAIFEFTFLWSLFEAQVMDNYATVPRIKERIETWNAEGTLEANLYDTELSYFRNRYFHNGELTGHFPFLNLRKSDCRELVQAVIEGKNDAPQDRMLALTLIIWRLRNNLFHGAKWAYGLRDQLENFTQANQVLIRMLENHGRPT